MRFNDDDKPKFSFHPSWKHLLYLIDLAVMFGLFQAGSWVFRTTVGENKLADNEQRREQVKIAGAQALSQADSVVTAERSRLAKASADSVSWSEDLLRRRAYLEGIANEQQQLNQTLTPMIDEVLDLHYRSRNALAEQEQYEKDIAERRAQVAERKAQAEAAAQQLEDAKYRHEDSLERLAQARSVRSHEPVGLFPDKTGLVLRQEISETEGLTNLEFQRSLWTPGVMDVGVSLGLGLGSGDVASSKQAGLLLTRPLIHRRLGLDLGAGYSVLTSPSGTDETGAYASASLRFSPLYRERLHFGLGARADQDNVTPYLLFGLGRR